MGGWTVLGVPVYTLRAYVGMGEGPSVLRKAGVVKALRAYGDVGDVGIPPLERDRVEGKVKNLSHFREANSRTYNAARSVRAERVAILGGECSETIGALAGLTDVFGGKAGMLWLDAHGDFNTPETSPSGYIGGMPLALAAGRGLELKLLPGAPPLADERLVHVGSRALDPPEAEAFSTSQAKLFSSQDVKRSGAATVARAAVKHLGDAADWIACHLDVDVVDPRLIPAVNYPTPGGLGLDEVAVMIKALSSTGKLRLLELTAYNATKDTDGKSARRIIDLMRRAFS